MRCLPWRRWQQRIESVQQARRVYARALHMNPGRSSAWGDAASTFYTEAQLRRAHRRLRPENPDALCRAAVTCVKGALWQLIGTCMLETIPWNGPGYCMALQSKGLARAKLSCCRIQDRVLSTFCMSLSSTQLIECRWLAHRSFQLRPMGVPGSMCLDRRLTRVCFGARSSPGPQAGALLGSPGQAVC